MIYSLVFIAPILITVANGALFKFAQPPPTGIDTMYCVKIECTRLHGGILEWGYAEVDHSVYADLSAFNCPFRRYNLTVRIVPKARPKINGHINVIVGSTRVYFIYIVL